MKPTCVSMDMIPEACALDDITCWAPFGSCARLRVLRLDQLHPVVSGNKWFKLKHNLEAALKAGKKTILTFGGGYSNHLVAAAFAAQQAGLESIGIVRGHYEGAEITPSLKACIDFGMHLVPFNKDEYSRFSGKGAVELYEKFPAAWIIPEGGANPEGALGASEIAALIPSDVNQVCVAVGTGTTLIGLRFGLPESVQLRGFCAAKKCEIESLAFFSNLSKPAPIMHSVHDPRFGKWKPELLNFMRDFYQKTGIPLDVVYTGKMMMKLSEMLAAGFFTPESNIVVIHSGGLQGNPAGLFEA